MFSIGVARRHVTLVAGPDRSQVASRLARRLASSTLGPLIAFSVKHEQFISRFSPSQGSPRGQRINLRHESPAVPASSICPNLFLTLPPRKVPPSLYRRWKLSGSVFSHHPPRVYDRFRRIFYVCLMERMFACVSAFPKRSRVRSGHSAVVRISRRPTTLSGATLAPSSVCTIFCSEPTTRGLRPSTLHFYFFLLCGTARNVHRVLKRGGRTIFATPA